MKLLFLIFAAYLSFSNCQASTPSITYQSQFGSSGPGSGQFNLPSGIAFNLPNILYVTDGANNRVQLFDTSGNYQSQFGIAGAGPGGMDNPNSIAIDSDSKTYIADLGNVRVDVFNTNQTYRTTIGAGGSFIAPLGIALDSVNNIYVADAGLSQIQVFNNLGVFQSSIGSPGSGDGQLSSPRGLAINNASNLIYVVDARNSRIQIFDTSGNYQSQFGTAGAGDGQLSNPAAIALDSSSNIYVVDSGNNRIQVFDNSGGYLCQFGTFGNGNGEFTNPLGIALDSSGKIYVIDSANNRVQILKISWPINTSVSTTSTTTVLQQQVTQSVISSTGLPAAQAASLATALFDGGARSAILSNLSSSQTASIATSAAQVLKSGSDATSSSGGTHQIASAAVDTNSSSQDSSSQNFSAFQDLSSSHVQQFRNISNQLPFLKFQSIHSLVKPITPFSFNNISPLVATPFENKTANLEPIFLPKGNSHVWVQPFGGTQRLDSYNSVTGVTSKNAGTVVGAGYNITPELTLGVLVGGTSSSYTSDQNQGNGSTANYYGGLYGGYAKPEGLNIKGSVVFGQDRYTSQRNLTALSLSAKNTHRGWNASGNTEIGYQFRYKKNSLTPFVGVGLSRTYQNSYQETNAYPFNLNIPPSTNKTLSTEIGVKFQTVTAIDDILIKPLMSLSVQKQQPLQRQGDATLSFADSASTFTAPASNEIKTYLASTIGFAAAFSQKITLSCLVTGKLRRHERAVEAVSKITYAF
ncbi:MAG: autotransporter domain-containing protein [Alphaproteobacteria bacterium]|nr:autotransporter domain-containing protein [Alphaproteobacteria bacterium]